MWFKILVFVAVIFGIYVFLRNKLGLNGLKEQNAQSMIECQECGVFFTKGDGVRFAGKLYCSKACRDKARS